MTTKNNKIGNQIKELRDTLDLTQEEFGERLGVSKSQICQWERGVLPSTSTLLKLSKEFGIKFTIKL